MKKPDVFLSYCHKNSAQANHLDFELKRLFNVTVKRDIRDISVFGSTKDFMDSVRDSDFVIKLISREYLESESCMYEVIQFIKDDTALMQYQEKTIPIILPNAREGKYNIFRAVGKLYWTKYWSTKYKELEVELKDFVDADFGIDKDAAIGEVRKELRMLKTIAESVSNQLLTNIVSNRLCVGYESLINNNFEQIISKIDPQRGRGHKSKANEDLKERKKKLDHLNDRFKFISIIDNADPTKPEFPPEHPKFPASKTYQIDVPGFKNVWVKDESTNPTGTHKDRLAFEVIRKFYKPLLKSNIINSKGGVPHLSMISSGSAALAIQRLLNLYNLPCLKVLADNLTPKPMISAMKNFGCELYFSNLSEKPFSCTEILNMTGNPHGVDISSRDMLDPINYVYYDWLSYEILNNDPDYCFIPFGTGDLFSNVLNISVREYLSANHDPRFQGNVESLKNCNFIGVTAKNSDSIMDKLFSPFLPFSPVKYKEIENYKEHGICGSKTTIQFLDESYLHAAMEIADKNNIVFEPSGIAGLGMLLEMKAGIDRNSKIVVVNTGKLKTDTLSIKKRNAEGIN